MPPPSEMRRGLAPQCNHAWTPILAAAIQKRDVRVAQGGTRPAYCTVGMILPDVITPRLVSASYLFHTRYHGILEKRARGAERAPSTLHAPRGSLHSVDVKRRCRAQLPAAIEVDVDELTAGEEL